MRATADYRAITITIERAELAGPDGARLDERFAGNGGGLLAGDYPAVELSESSAKLIREALLKP